MQFFYGKINKKKFGLFSLGIQIKFDNLLSYVNIISRSIIIDRFVIKMI